MKIINFKGKKYFFGGEHLDEDGFIATKHQYENGLCSFAHYFPSQGVMRFCEKIGERKDLKIIDDKECNVKDMAFHNLLTSKTWTFNF